VAAGRGRLSGISAALFLLMFILVASELIEMIPLAALTGVMFMVVIGAFEWSSLRIVGKIPRSDAFVLVLVLVLVLVSGVTVATDLAIAVVVGVIVSALVFAWEHAKHIRVESFISAIEAIDTVSERYVNAGKNPAPAPPESGMPPVTTQGR
jgi:SulP family sulfate permease